jgi:hypothetical protein
MARILNEGMPPTGVVVQVALQLQAPLETPEIRGQPHPLYVNPFPVVQVVQVVQVVLRVPQGLREV